MNLQKTHNFLRQNFIFYLVGAVVILGIKYYYSQTDCDSLLWILAPTTYWVEFLSGIPFTYISGTGYVNHSLRLWIAPSCSGVRFLIITTAMLIFSFVHIVASPKKTPVLNTAQRVRRGLEWIAASVTFSWLFTVFVNGLRIITAIFLPLYLDRAGLMKGLLTADRLHTMIGVVVYFIALLTLYRLAAYLIQRRRDWTGQSVNTDQSSEAYRKQFLVMFARKCIPPVFWYFFMTVGLPFLNRAYLNDTAEFMEYTVLITCCLALILLPYCFLSLLNSRKRNVN